MVIDKEPNDWGFWIADFGFGGYGKCDVGYGMWDLRYRGQGKNAKCQNPNDK